MQDEIKSRVASHIEGADVAVEGEAGRYLITVVSEAFRGLNRVKQQQLVYAAIQDLIADGSVHAVTIKASTPDPA